MTRTRYALKVVSLWVKESSPPGRIIHQSSDAYAILRPYFEAVRDDRERFVSLALTCKHSLMGLIEVSVGGTTTSLVDPKVLFRTLLVMGAAKFILAHNHPSGDSTPSPEDLTLTHRLVAAGHVLALECLDHLIIADGTAKYRSLADTGQLRGRDGDMP